MDGLLNRLSLSGVGCHIGFEFVGAFGYADDLNLLAPTLRALRIMIKICESYADEFSIKFNGSKSKLIEYKGLNNVLPRGRNVLIAGRRYREDVTVNDAPVEQKESEVHLGHRISPDHQGASVRKGLSDFWTQFNCFNARFGRFPSTVQFKLFSTFCMSMYGCAIFKIADSRSLFAAHRKAIRKMFRLPWTTHCAVIDTIQTPTEIILMDRFSKFLDSCLKLSGHPVRLVMLGALDDKRSLAYQNFEYCRQNRNNAILRANHLIASSEYDINVLFDMCDVRDGLLTCSNFGPSQIRDIIHCICLE